MPHIEGDLRAPQGARFAIIASRWNPRITDALVAAARQAFVGNGVDEAALDVVRVPGAWELPLIAKKLAGSGKYDAIIALGAVIRGGTPHFDYVAGECAKGLGVVSLDSGLPVSFGVLTVDSIEQAIERSGTKAGNKGGDAALVAIEMISVLKAVG